ncbi:hypothetical protein F2P81_004612 [Scophthalmus maximus]|uniref:Uncharacterized protein n=1 Tax=Scophthalmus maximus TaxID=52904 RepID=A0A6A4TDK0_SCOMX|nr:hypothetical protein F2P81_004612 [Scophthalmus maximus]
MVLSNGPPTVQSDWLRVMSHSLSALKANATDGYRKNAKTGAAPINWMPLHHTSKPPFMKTLKRTVMTCYDLASFEVGDVSVLVSAFSKTMAAPTPTTAPEEEVEIYTPDNFKSNVWRYFGFPKIPGKITGAVHVSDSSTYLPCTYSRGTERDLLWIGNDEMHHRLMS